MNKPLFSIIIPTYNAEATIENCLKSIKNQIFKDYEVLIIDGVSSDNTLFIAKAFEGIYIKTFSEPDKGIYDAMNKGISKAKGTWLYFLGSDDELYNSEVLQRISAITSYQKAKMIYGDVFMIDTNAKYCGMVNDVEILHKNICHQAIFYNHEIFKNHLYSLRFNVFADHQFNLMVFKHHYNAIFYCNVIVAKYANTGFSSKTEDDFEFELNNIKKEFLKSKGIVFKFRNAIYYSQLQMKPSIIRGTLLKFFKFIS